MSIADTVIEQDGFGLVPRPDYGRQGKPFEIVRRYTLTNKNKASVRLISWGAGIQSIRVPNKRGFLGDVVLGFDDMDGYLRHRYMGSVIGRVANRISDGRMCINDKEYSLTTNEGGRNHFNGGANAFDNVNWESHVVNKQVVMSHMSPAGDEGYPGCMLTQVKYSWTNDNQLRVNVSAIATEPTPTNITSYCLFNLAGHGTGPGEVKKHVATINADSWTFTDVRENLPTGAIRPVDRTVYDLRLPTQLSRDRLYSVPGGGYNHNLCVNSPSSWCYRFHARILHPESGRFLEVYSNHPGLQFYTGNDLPDPEREYPPDWEDYICCGCAVDSVDSLDRVNDASKAQPEVRGKDGAQYRRHGGFALSPQNYPNAVNVKHFPSCILYPGKIYVHDMTYKFGVIADSRFGANDRQSNLNKQYI